MNNSHKLSLLSMLIGSLFLTGCGGADTSIEEKAPIVAEEETEEGTSNGFIIESLGRLAVLSADSADTSIFDLDDNDLLDSFALTFDSSTLTASADYRYAVLVNRTRQC